MIRFLCLCLLFAFASTAFAQDCANGKCLNNQKTVRVRTVEAQSTTTTVQQSTTVVREGRFRIFRRRCR